MSDVNIEVSEAENGILIRYTGDNSSVLYRRHYERMEDAKEAMKKAKEKYVREDGSNTIFIEAAGTSVAFVEQRYYQLTVGECDVADRLESLLSLPELDRSDRDGKWVLEFGAKFNFDDWFDSISKIPRAKISEFGGFSR